MPLITSKTNLKDLKGTLMGAQRNPAIVKDIPKSRTRSGIGSGLLLQVTKRADDALRMTKLMGRPEGVRFIANQALLNQSALTSAINRGQRPSIRQAGRDAARSIGVTASAIAQAGVSGTGLRLIQGFTPANGGYLTEGSSIRGALASLNPFGSGDNQIAKGGIALRGETINDFSIESSYEGLDGLNTGTKKAGLEFVQQSKGKYSIQSDEDFKKFYNLSPSYFTASSINKGNLKNKESRPFKAFDQFTKSNFLSRNDPDNVPRRVSTGLIRAAKAGSYRKKPQEDTLSRRFYLPKLAEVPRGFPAPARLADRINIIDVETEEILEGKESLQVIPFKFKVYPGSGNPEFLYFRAYIESLGDNYSGNWTSTNYIGRADPIFTYDSFSRGVSFSFKIATTSKWDLQPLYNKLNRLVSTTAPHYEDNGFFKQGVFVELTIGDYVKKIPGFFQSIDVNWDITYPWEVEESGRKVPHILDVNCSFQPIHNFNPQYGDGFNFIGSIDDVNFVERTRPTVPNELPEPEIIEDIDIQIDSEVPPPPPIEETPEERELINYSFLRRNVAPEGFNRPIQAPTFRPTTQTRQPRLRIFNELGGDPFDVGGEVINSTSTLA